MKRASSCLAPALLLLAIVASASAQTRDITVEGMRSEKRVALIIGNAVYSTSPLRNPVNDARAMAQALRELGFDVLARENIGQKDMRRAIIDFGDRLQGGGVGLFYFAGHGLQVAGRNYMVPIDATIKSEREVEVESVDVASVLARMDTARNRLNVVILDACRDNPFGRSFRSTARGLAAIDAPSGTLIAYATAPGRLARDGEGANGLYTAELLKAIREPGLTLENVFKRVRGAVRQKTNGEQVPWEASSVEGEFVFRFPPGSKVAAVQPRPEPSRKPNVTEEVVRESGSLSVRSKPPGVEVWLGEQKLGVTNEGRALVVNDLAVGSYRLKARKAGHADWERDIEVKASKRSEVSIELQVASLPLGTLSAGYELSEVRRILRESIQATSVIVVRPSNLDSFLLDTVRAQLRADDIAGAIQTAAMIKEGTSDKDFATWNIAVAQAKDGNATLALLTAAAIQKVDNRAAALAAVAAARAKAGDASGAATTFQEALQLAASIPKEEDRDDALGSIVAAQYGGGEFVAALQTNRMRPATKWQASGFSEIAKAQVKAGDKVAAIATLREALQKVAAVPNQKDRVLGMSMIAEALIEVGDRAGAVSILQQAVQTASGRERPDFALLYVAAAQVKAGDVAGAFQTAASMQDVMNKVRAFEGIGEILWKGGDKTRAREAFEQVFQIAMAAKSAVGFRDTANTQASAGDISGALRTVALLDDNYYDKYQVVANIALAQFRSGDLPAARATLQQAVQKITALRGDAKDVDNHAHNIAPAQAEVGDVAGAIQTWTLLAEGGYWKPIVAGYITKAQAEAGEAREALAWAASHDSAVVKARALYGVAEGILARRDAAEKTKAKPN